MSTSPFSTRGRIPGPTGLYPEHTAGHSSHRILAERFGEKLRSPEHTPAEGIRISGPYPRITVTEGYVAGKPGAKAFQASSQDEMFETYRSFASGHTHTDIYLAPYLPSGHNNYQMVIPSSAEGINLEGRMHYKIPAGSTLFTSTIPFKERGYSAAHYGSEIDAIKKEHPNAILFVQVRACQEQKRVEVLGFDPTTASVAVPPRNGREVAHLYSNSAYSSLQAGTLRPDSTRPSSYASKRFGAVDEISHRNEETYAQTLANRLEHLIGQGIGLKVSAWEKTDREMMILPSVPSHVTSGAELGNSGLCPFHYLDSVHKVTAHTIPLKPGESFTASHPALAEYVSENPFALHLCRRHTDYSTPEKTRRIEIVSIE